MEKPRLNNDGSCPACANGWVCVYHSAEGIRKDRARAAMFREIVASNRTNEIARTCARYELESDEMRTREEKAMQFFNGKPPERRRARPATAAHKQNG